MGDNWRPPIPCAECASAWLDTRRRSGTSQGIFHCAHRQVLTLVVVRNGKPVHTICSAPCTTEEALDEIDRQESRLRAAGMLKGQQSN